jgi:hypothetical protein
MKRLHDNEDSIKTQDVEQKVFCVERLSKMTFDLELRKWLADFALA